MLACPRCGGCLRVLAILEAPAVARKILTHVEVAIGRLGLLAWRLYGLHRHE